MWGATDRLQHLQLLHRWRACLLLSGPRQDPSPCCGDSCSCQVTIRLQSPQASQTEQQSCGPVVCWPGLSQSLAHSQWREPLTQRAGLSCSLHFWSRVPCCALQLLDGWLSITSPWASLHPRAGAVPRSRPPWVTQFLKIGFLPGWHQAIALRVTQSNKVGSLSTTNPSLGRITVSPKTTTRPEVCEGCGLVPRVRLPCLPWAHQHLI